MDSSRRRSTSGKADFAWLSVRVRMRFCGLAGEWMVENGKKERTFMLLTHQLSANAVVTALFLVCHQHPIQTISIQNGKLSHTVVTRYSTLIHCNAALPESAPSLPVIMMIDLVCTFDGLWKLVHPAAKFRMHVANLQAHSIAYATSTPCYNHSLLPVATNKIFAFNVYSTCSALSV